MLEFNLISYLCSRLCHDLVGPIGALSNGVEILAEEDDVEMREQATQLLAASASEASKRLQYFRMAFGALGGLGDRIGRDEVRRTAGLFFEGGRCQLIWDSSVNLPAELAKNDAKLLLNLFLLAQSCLPRGGSIAVGAVDVNSYHVKAAGAGARIEESAGRALAGGLDETELDSHNAIAAYAGVLARQRDGVLVARGDSENAVVIEFRGT